MINNGYIAFVSESGGGIDGDGNVTPPTKTTSGFIPCNNKVNTRNYGFVVEGQFQIAKYSVYIDRAKAPDLVLDDLKEIVLQGEDSIDLGTFQVQNKEYLTLMDKYKIVV